MDTWDNRLKKKNIMGYVVTKTIFTSVAERNISFVVIWSQNYLSYGRSLANFYE